MGFFGVRGTIDLCGHLIMRMCWPAALPRVMFILIKLWGSVSSGGGVWNTAHVARERIFRIHNVDYNLSLKAGILVI